MTRALNIVFMGTPPFAVAALDALVKAGHNIVAVYSQPPRPAGRGYALQKSAVHQYADEHGFAVYTPKSLKKDADARAVFAAHHADVAVVAAYGLILPQDVLDAPAHGCINIHASLLPRWRGAAPIQRAILAGDRESGVCIMQMEAGLDTGPVLIRDSVAITDVTTATTLHDALAAMGGRLIVAALAEINTLAPQTQPEDGVTYAHMLSKDDGRIHWSQSAAQIERQLRALTPWPGVWCRLSNNQRLKVIAAARTDATSNKPAGTVLDDGTVACGDHSVLRLVTIQPENKKAMAARDAINGGIIKTGDVLQ